MFWCSIRFDVRLVGSLCIVGLMNVLGGFHCGVCVLVVFFNVIVGVGVICGLIW